MSLYPLCVGREKLMEFFDDFFLCSQHGYLSQYGYLPETDSGVGNLLMADQLEDAIKQLQVIFHRL